MAAMSNFDSATLNALYGARTKIDILIRELELVESGQVQSDAAKYGLSKEQEAKALADLDTLKQDLATQVKMILELIISGGGK